MRACNIAQLHAVWVCFIAPPQKCQHRRNEKRNIIKLQSRFLIWPSPNRQKPHTRIGRIMHAQGFCSPHFALTLQTFAYMLHTCCVHVAYMLRTIRARCKHVAVDLCVDSADLCVDSAQPLATWPKNVYYRARSKKQCRVQENKSATSRRNIKHFTTKV